MDNLDFNYFCTSCTKECSYRQANCFTHYQIKCYKKGEHIAYKGESAKVLSILVEGCINTEIVLESGISYSSKIHESPYPFGALALFAADNYYRADMVAVEDCTVITVSKERIEEQMIQCRTFLRNFIGYTTTKVDVFANHLTVLTNKSLKARLAFYLISITENGVFHFDKKLEALATYLAVERPSLSRAIAQLVADGIISYHRGNGEILDTHKLKNLLD